MRDQSTQQQNKPAKSLGLIHQPLHTFATDPMHCGTACSSLAAERPADTPRSPRILDLPSFYHIFGTFQLLTYMHPKLPMLFSFSDYCPHPPLMESSSEVLRL